MVISNDNNELIGKRAITNYEVISRFNYVSLVNVFWIPRTHQIRVHMKSIGHPLLMMKDMGEIKF